MPLSFSFRPTSKSKLKAPLKILLGVFPENQKIHNFPCTVRVDAACSPSHFVLFCLFIFALCDSQTKNDLIQLEFLEPNQDARVSLAVLSTQDF